MPVPHFFGCRLGDGPSRFTSAASLRVIAADFFGSRSPRDVPIVGVKE
jgi:hypothetical protein